MGYETKLLIGKIYKLNNSDKRYYFNEIASIDLCKTNIFGDTRIDTKKPLGKFKKVYLYGLSGNDIITEDSYGSPLVANNPIEVLNLIKKANKKEYYRRYAAAIPLLESIISDFPDNELACVLYGH